MEKRITFYPPQTWRGRFLGTILTLVAFLLGATQAEAQTVHIALDNGSLLTGVGPGNDSGWEQGFHTMWRHEQLSLTMMASDRDKLEASGEMGYPSNVYAKHSVVSGDNKDKRFCIIGGRRPSFIVVSLPKGYRITGYTLVLSNDLQGGNFGGRFSSINDNDEGSGRYGTMRFYETAPWETNGTNSGTDRQYQGEDGNGYNENRVKNIEPGPDWQGNQIGSNGIVEGKYFITQALDASGSGDINTNDTKGKKYTISRTAHDTGKVDENGQPIYDMGNQLYFRLVKDYCFYGITIEEFRIEFTAEGTFAADVVPDAVGEATSCVASPFKTSKIDIGEMRERQKTSNGQSYTHYAFEYSQVKDLQAYNYLYQDDAIKNGAPANVATQKNIRPVEVDGKMLYALKSDTYFLEPPIEIATSGGNAPIGYRIVGALFTPLWGTETDEFKPGSYKLKIYKRDGSGLMRWKYDDESGYLQTDDESKPDYIEISAENDTDLGKVIDIGLFNNDAVKFEIETTGDAQALVQITLLLQALDPYIDKMDIVCTANDNVLHLTQSFTADDFSVSGGKFIFYVPEDYYNQELTFTFSDLYSKYGDETYYGGGSGFGRYSFVTSPYFVKVDGNGDTGLYNNTNYSPNARYNDKVYTSTAGNIRFKFNNAEDLAAEAQAGNLVETPFSVAYYLTTTDPGDPIAGTAANSSKGAEFIPVKLKASQADQRSGIFFVFTADETRWNIAQTTAWQHRYYAFYRMEIEAVAKTFTPAFTPIKIYDKTLYTKDGTKKEDSMWGLIVDVADTENGHKVQGYLTYQEIINAIQYGREATYWKQGDDIPAGKNVGDLKTPYVAPVLKDAAHSADGPTSMEQILYVDGTPLYAMLNSAEDQDVITVEDLREKLAMNSLVFLPENTTSTFDNTAFETSTGFVAGKDIKLTDKQPFFTPYDIQVASANTTTYTRMISAEENGQADYATIIVPFALTVDDNGIHTNPDGSQFSVNVMDNGQEMKLQPGSAVDHGTAFFKPLKNAGSTVANTPYMVSIMSRGTLKDGENFVVEQNGASIAATPTNGATNEFGTGWMHKGKTTAKATFDEKEYNFTNVATFSGAKFDRDLSENVFYFAAGKYLDLHTLAASAGPYLYVYPFRNVFTYPDNGAWVSRASAAKAMKWFDISFDEPNHSSIVTEVDNIANADLMVKLGKGVVTLSATRSQDVNISTLSGMNMKRVALDAGDTQTVVLPAGIYLINNVKVIVK